MIEEYKFVNGQYSDIQKKLNQWRHDYDILVLFMNTVADKKGDEETILLIKRTKKQNV